ncbi:unnamed protein product [Eruca vesicaria subsp. sativa]|uniref:HTH La-type RNA-binding domain-containing protein n=1 Tax=Eruca vesicaria subsp. sativa TaxID=29727 RepID=A0ABC8M103_ERUVS|nr:unnamed protein product [Eruca vesicaria subsp. sativa]
MAKEKSDYSEKFEGNGENKPARNKSSTDSLISLGFDGSSSSVSFFSQRSSILAEKERMHQEFIEQAIAFTQGMVVQPYTSPRGHNQGNEFAPRSHVSTQNQQNSYKNQNVSYHPHQSHGGRGRQNEEHVKQKWNPQGHFNGQGGFPPPPREGTPAFVRPPPSIYAQHIPVQQLFYPIPFTDLPPPMMYYSHRVPFIEPHAALFPSQNPDGMPSIEPSPFLVPSQKAPLKTKILNQVQYYFSEDNLPNDVYLRKRMNDEGFVHIEFIAGFNKLKALTSNVQLILDSLRDSYIVEVQTNVPTGSRVRAPPTRELFPVNRSVFQ